MNSLANRFDKLQVAYISFLHFLQSQAVIALRVICLISTKKFLYENCQRKITKICQVC